MHSVKGDLAMDIHHLTKLGEKLGDLVSTYSIRSIVIQIPYNGTRPTAHIVYADGSRGTLELRGEEWVWPDDPNPCPGDIAARDAF